MKRLPILLLFVSILLLFPVTRVSARQRIGVDVPYSIPTQKSQMLDSQFVVYAYEAVLNRLPFDTEGTYWMSRTFTRQEVFNQIMSSAEFTGNGTLNNNLGYVKRLHQYIWHRDTPADNNTEVQGQVKYIQDLIAGGTNRSEAWYDLLIAFINNPAFTAKNCTTSAYTYETPLNANTPSLTDLFAGTAHFQSPYEAQETHTDYAGQSLATNKISTIQYNGSYIGAGYVNQVQPYDIFIWSSTDGLNFTSAQELFKGRNSGMGLYDPTITVDSSYCPKRYVITMECDSALCTSESSTPQIPWSWSKPKKNVATTTMNGRSQSASSGISLVDITGERYAYWAVVDDNDLNKYDPVATVYTRGAKLSSDQSINSLGGTTVMSAEKDVHCASSWDCNNVAIQDMRYEDGYYYAPYNGANYVACGRASNDTGYTNDWDISVARSTSPLGNFRNNKLGILINSEVKDRCATAYPMINNINGELYLYYNYISYKITPNLPGVFWGTLRSKLVWNTKQGDLNGDEKVDIFDYNQLVSNFGHPYTIFDYNQLIANYGK